MKTLAKAKVNGFVRMLDMGEAIQRAMAKGKYEPEQTAWVKKTLKRGGRFVDIGANFGYYTSLASSIVGATGRVFAFEPSPVAQESLREMIELNRITNIELIHAAVGDRAGELELLLPLDGPVHSPSVFHSEGRFTPFTAPMLALDDYAPLNDGTPIDLMKIDVEGFEPNVIAGMRSLAQRGIVRNLLCEFNSGWLRRNLNTTPAQLLETILGLGFTITYTGKKVTGMESCGKVPYELQDLLFTWK